MRGEGKGAIISGGAGGIGRAVATAYAAEGARAVVADVNAGEAERVAAEIGRGAIGVGVDVTAQASIDAMVATVVERAGNKPVTITWLVTQEDGGLRIADVVAEGMSLRMTQRSDYASFLAHHDGDVGALIEALKKQVGE